MHGREAIRLLAMAVLIGALLRSTAWGQDISWTNAGSGFWTNAGSWSLGAAPSNNPNVNLTSTGSKTVTIDAATPAGNLTITNLTISGSVSDTNTLLLSGNATPLNVLGALTVKGGNGLVVDGGRLVTTNAALWNLVGYQGDGSMTVSNGTWLANYVGVGWSSHGTLTLAGGTNNITSLLLSQSLGVTGTVLLTGGQLVTTNGGVLVGNVGAGVMTVSGGTWLGNTVGVGGRGSALTLAGGTNVFAGTLTVGSAATTTGTVWLTGGQLVTTNNTTTVGDYSGAFGTMIVSNGTWLGNAVTVGNGGQGTLTLAGGTNVFASQLLAGNQNGSVGTVWLTGGQLVTTNNTVTVGNAGVGAMTVSGGTWLGNTVTVGGRGSALNLAGGTNVFSGALNVGSAASATTGTVLMTGGQLVTTNSTTTVGNAGVGAMTVSGGTWLGNAVTVGNGGQGTLTLAGGTNTMAGALTVGSTTTGTVLMTGGQLVTTNNTATVGNSGVGTMTVSDGTWLANAVTVGNTGQGTLTLAGGTNTMAGVLTVGSYGSATGTVLMTGGQLVTTNAVSWNLVGSGGLGAMTVSNGTWLGNQVAVGWAAPGTLTLAGGTNVFSYLLLSQSSGITGTVLMTGGQLVTTNNNAWNVSVGSVGVGAMTVSGGTWLGNQVVVGGRGSALTLAGGTNVFSGALNVGSAASATTGTIWLTGGQLVTTNNTVTVGNAGDGAMTVSNGTWLAKDVTVGNGGQGTLTIAGGTNVFSGQLAIGQSGGATVLLTGGQLVTTNVWNYLGWAGAGVGHMTVSNGTWLAGIVTLGVFGGGNTLTIAGGQVFATTVTVGNAQNSNSVLVTGGGVLEATTLANAANVGNSIGNVGGIYQFTSATPTITPNGNVISITNGTISFRGINNADVKGNWSGSQLANVLFSGNNTFRLNAASNTTSSQDYTFNTGLGATNYVGLEMINGATAWRGGSLTIGNGGTMLVSNTAASIAGALTNSGTMTVMNGSVVYGGNVVNLGAYASDPSTNTFNGNFTVGPTATVVAAANDIYAFGSNFVMQSANRAFDMSVARVVFADTGYGITTGNTNHTFDLTGSGAVDKGSNWLDHTQLATNFSIGTLTIASGNRLTLTGNAGTNALYAGVLDLSAWATNASALTNTLQAALSLNINLYYDKYAPNNAYLQGVEFGLWGGGGLLIPIPEPSALVLTLAATALSVFILRRKERQA